MDHFFVATHMTPGKVYGRANLKSFVKNGSIYYLHELEQKNPRNCLFIVEHNGQ